MEKNRDNNPLFFITEQLEFPPLENANAEGLLAVGGDLSSERLLLAYHKGIFPWFNEDSLILWWSPDPRMILFPDEIRISKSMRKVIRDNRFRITKNTCFQEVLYYCANVKRVGQEGTWITRDMKAAYYELHKKGYAHSYEVWEDEVLVGGLYGIDLGHVFCGESMFSIADNASKFAFIHLARELKAKEYTLIDCQQHTKHLESLGAREIPRSEFIRLLEGKNQGGQ
ncbi:MAG: leucyl/phenylalanyl-tRNA--protein transferase [Bacteroidota bacterium]